MLFTAARDSEITAMFFILVALSVIHEKNLQAVAAAL
jgi:hypothetical protein